MGGPDGGMRWRAWLPAALLVLPACLAFSPVLSAGFVAFDDDWTVYRNPHVLGGLSREGLLWAARSIEHANWHPLTWLSHQADATLFGARPAGHHAVSLALHLLNAVLLFLALRGLSGAIRPAFVASALFALHPLRVESVAWVAERKDVLSGACLMLVLLSYLAYVRRPGAVRLAAVTLALAAGLTSKPTLVTLPFLLLLLDLWPLARWSPSGGAIPLRRLVLEKLPLFALCAASSWITWTAQAAGGAVETLAAVPPGWRLARVPLAYAGYLGRTLWPADLAVLYPLPLSPPAAAVAVGAALLLGILLGLAVARFRTQPALFVGGLWFLGALVPVIGLVQVGSQFVADRYTYLPHIGLFAAAAWGLPAPWTAGERHRRLLAAAVAAALAVLSAMTWAQAGTWKNSETLFARTLARTRDNWFIAYNLGVVLAQQGRHEEAIARYEEALRISPTFARARGGLGASLAAQGRDREAVPHYEEALRARPEDPLVHFNLALSLERLGRTERSARHYAAAVRLDPADAESRLRLARIRSRREGAAPAP